MLADAASGLRRKNPLGAIEAFTRAFQPASGPRLLVKVWNADEDQRGVDELIRAAAGRPDIEVVDRWLDRQAFADLLRSSLCLVSLHRAEGLGLPIFEALGAGIPVVASNFSGPAAWLDESNAHPVATAPAAVPRDAAPYPAGARWADPDLDDGARQLRAVWHDPDDARARAARGRTLVEATFSPGAIGDRLCERLEARLRTSGRRVPRSLLRPAVQVVVAATDPWPALEPFLLAAGPEVEAIGGELLIGSTDAAVLPDGQRPAWVQMHPTGSRNPFDLRAAALDAADADLVVVTEDHCRPVPGWLSAYEAAAQRSASGVLAGPVRNGTSPTAADWANYLLGFAAYAPPLHEVPTDRCPTVANCAVPGPVLRDASPRGSAPGARLPSGWFERDLVAELWRVGGTTLVPEAAVVHDQSFPAWHHLRNHFDDGRCAGAHAAGTDPTFRPSCRPRELAIVARTFLRGVVAAVAPRPDLIDPHRRARIWLRALAAARSIGLAVGAQLGPGRSGDRLD